MCYSGQCFFESGGGPSGPGGCIVSDHDTFRSTYGVTCCAAGGAFDDEGSFEWYQENKDICETICAMWIRNRYSF